MCLQVYIAFSPRGKEQISARSDLEVSDTPTLTARVDLHAAFGVPAAGMHCPLQVDAVENSNLRLGHNSGGRWQSRWKFLLGFGGQTDLSAYDPLLCLAVATTRVMPLSSRERDFLGTSNFRLYQTYLRIQVMRRVVPHRSTSPSGTTRLDFDAKSQIAKTAKSKEPTPLVISNM
jgi:hypothetical protein